MADDWMFLLLVFGLAGAAGCRFAQWSVGVDAGSRVMRAFIRVFLAAAGIGAVGLVIAALTGGISL